MVTDVRAVEDPLLDALACAIDTLAADELWRRDDEVMVGRLDRLGSLAGRVHGLQLQVVNEVTGRGTIERQQGWSVTDRLAATLHEPVRKARATTGLARDLRREGRDQVLAGIIAGRVSAAQARVICAIDDEIPDEASVEQRASVVGVLVEHCASYEPKVIREIGNYLLERMFPEQVDAKLAEDLAREEKRAQRRRFLSFGATTGGTTDFHGRLPTVQATRLKQLLDAYVERDRKAGGRSAADAVLDPDVERPTKSQRRADALCHVMDDLDAHGCAPESGGDRPTTMILIDFDVLVSGLRGAELVGTDEVVDPGTARRMACAGNILPVVCDGDSVPLDVGRAARLFTGGLRKAIIARDRGCVFPGCDAPAARCDCHHLVPWWLGGVTRLDNAVLLCPHHHHLVEPDPTVDQATRWTVRLDAHGLPEVVPPWRVDPARRPRRHARFLFRRQNPDLLPGLQDGPPADTRGGSGRPAGAHGDGDRPADPRGDGDRPANPYGGKDRPADARGSTGRSASDQPASVRPDSDRIRPAQDHRNTDHPRQDHPRQDHPSRDCRDHDQRSLQPAGAGADPP